MKQSRNTSRSPWLLLTALLLQLAVAVRTTEGRQRVLLYSRTEGFRHASIPNAIKAFEKLGEENDVHMFNTEQESHFEDADWVNNWDAIVFVSVSGKALTHTGQVNLMKYIENGGGFMGIHEACDALYQSPWYGRLLGAFFNYHPYIQHFDLNVETHDHPSTSFLDKHWSVYDEVYTFNSNPRDVGATVVLTADPHSFNDPTGPGIGVLRKMEGSHPIAWYKEGDLISEPDKNPGGGVMDKKATPKDQRGSGGDGRSFYTALGHTKKSWKNKKMLQHVWGGLKWVLDSPSIRSNNASLPASAPGTKFIAATSSGNGSSPSSGGTNGTAGIPTHSGVATATLKGSSALDASASLVMVMTIACLVSAASLTLS